MAVELDREPDRTLQGADEIVGVVRIENPGHVLDADRIGAHLLEGLGFVDVVLEVVDLAPDLGAGERERYGALNVLLRLLDRLEGRLEVALVVERVEDAEDVDPGFGRLLDEGLDDVVGVVPVADEVLAAEQHLKRGLLDPLLELDEPLPGILVEIARRHVEGRSAPDLHRMEADPVHLLRDGEHVLGAHASGDRGLMAVAEGRIGYLDRFEGLEELGVLGHIASPSEKSL